ncbi:folate family ECF transporter S component [Companilactobacillus sp. DQM5]|uniref:folate family ECF transporter S component n=1 Tax=Companilactobacillus sp. DQM5 TaxID=3463359 RepID=UPI004058A29D
MNNSAKTNAFRVRELTWLAALIALQIILSKLTVGTSIVKVGFGFIATGLIGYYFGPIKATIAGMLTDIIANVVFPDPAGFFWGFTLSAGIAGFIYGLVLFQKKITFWRVLLVVTLIVVIINMFFTTLWISMMGAVPFSKLFLIRLPKELITLPIQTIILWLVLAWVDRSKFRRIN